MPEAAEECCRVRRPDARLMKKRMSVVLAEGAINGQVQGTMRPDEVADARWAMTMAVSLPRWLMLIRLTTTNDGWMT